MQDTASLRISVDTKDIKSANSELDKLTKTSGNTEKTTNQLTRSYASLSNVLGTLSIAALTHEFIKIADEMKLLDARLKMVSASTAEYVSQKKELLAISKETYSSIAEITTLYTKLDPALKSLGATTKDVNNITESFAKGLKIGGAGANEAASATLQFAQAMGSGVLRGEEFNAIMEASPKLMAYLAEGLGVPQTALRKMAMEGELSAGRVSAALLKMTTKINEDFTQIPVTVGMATANLKTDLATSIEQFDKTTGATKALAETISGLSVDLTKYGTDITTFFVATSKFINQHNEALKTTTALVGGIATAYYGFIAGGAVIAGIRGITTATYGLRAAMIALQASSPILLAISVGLGVATAAYLAHDNALEKKNYSTIGSIDELTKAHERLLQKRKEIQSDKFALDKTQKKETAIVDAELKKIEDRLNSIGTARSNNVDKAKKEAEELKKSAKTLEENAKKLTPPKEDKKAEAAARKAEAKRLKDIEEEAKIQRGYLDSYADLEAQNAIEAYNNQITYINDNADREAQAAIDQYNIEIGYIDDLASRQADSALAFYSMVQSESDKINEKNLELFLANEGLWNTDQMQIFFQKWQESIESVKSDMDFSANIEFDPSMMEGLQKAIAGVSKSMDLLSEEEIQYQKNKAKTGQTSEAIAKNEADHNKSQIRGYANLAGSMSAMFKQGSDEAKAFTIIQSGLAAVEAVTGIAAQAKLPFPYNIAAMAGTAASVYGFLNAAGIAGGGSGGGASIPAPANSGTVLGDSMAVSESTNNIVDLLESIHTSEYSELRDINRAVTSMAQGIEGAVTSIFKTGLLDTSGVQLSSKVGALGSIGLGSLGSSKQYIAGSGFGIESGTLGQKASGDLGASTFVDIETAKKNWLGQASYSHKIVTTALDDASSQSISLIYKSFSDTMMAINEGLGADLAPAITNYTMDAIKLNLAGKTGEESVKALNDAFSALGDKMSSDVFGTILNQYQNLGEGLLETAVRVITEKAVVIQDLGDIGKSVSGDIISISQSLVGLSGSLSNFQDNVASYYDKYFTDEEKLSRSQSKFIELFSDLGYALPTSTDAFRNIIDALNLSTLSGQETFTTLMNISGSFYDFSSTLADIAKQAEEDAKQAIESQNNLRTSLFDNIKSFIDSVSGAMTTKDPSTSFYQFTLSFNTMIDAIGSGSADLLDIGNNALQNAQSYLNVVTATATSSRDVQFAKAMLLNKFSGVIAEPDTSLNTINSTLNNNNAALVKELQSLKFELNSIKEYTITQTATNLKILSTQRSILGETATA